MAQTSQSPARDGARQASTHVQSPANIAITLTAQADLVELVVTWRLSIGRKFTGLTVKPDARWPTMWRIHFAGQVSDLVNLSRAKDAAVSLARPNGLGGEEVVHWHRRETAPEASPSRFSVAPVPHPALGWLNRPFWRAGA